MDIYTFVYRFEYVNRCKNYFNRGLYETTLALCNKVFKKQNMFYSEAILCKYTVSCYYYSFKDELWKGIHIISAFTYFLQQKISIERNNNNLQVAKIGF